MSKHALIRNALLFLVFFNLLLCAVFLSNRLVAKFTTNSPPTEHRYLYGHLNRLARSIDNDTVVFLGSSSIQALHVSKIAPGAMNLGVGGEQLGPMAKRIQNYQYLSDAEAAVIMAGLNDICDGPESAFIRYEAFMEKMPVDLPVVVIGLQPATTKSLCSDLPAYLSQYNAKLEQFCNQLQHCIYADLAEHLNDAQMQSNTSISHFFEADGIHLNRSGYEELNTLIIGKLDKLLR